MPEFIDFHEGYHNLTQDLLEQSFKRDRENEASEGVHFKRSWADPSTGRIFCLSEGPSKLAVLRVHQKAGHATHFIFEVPYSSE